MLCQHSYESYTPEGLIDFETEVGDVVGGEWRDENIGECVFKGLPKSDTCNASKNAQLIRDSFANHF